MLMSVFVVTSAMAVSNALWRKFARTASGTLNCNHRFKSSAIAANCSSAASKPEALAFNSFVAVLGMEAMDELNEIRAFQRSLFQSEVLIRPQIIDSKLICPWFFAGRFAVEE